MAKKDDVDDKFNALLPAATESVELTEAEKLAIEAEARAEVTKELKAEKRKEFKAAAKQRLKKQTLFQHGKDEEGEDLELVLVQLAPHMPFIRLDNNVFYHGRAYRLSTKTAACIKEQMYRGDMHMHEISGKNMKEFFGQRPAGLKIGPNTPIPSNMIN
jgi:hypothetical protein